MKPVIGKLNKSLCFLNYINTKWGYDSQKNFILVSTIPFNIKVVFDYRRKRL